jgi:signal transduction histidine kinase
MKQERPPVLSVPVSTISSLRPPVDAIIGYSDALLAGWFGELTDKQREYLQDINASGRHLRAQLNEILDHAPREGGTQDAGADGA